MIRARVLITLLFLLGPAWAHAAISGVVFTTDPQNLAPDTVSAALTVQSQAGGASMALPQTGCLLLQSTSPQGQFSSSATNWSAVSVITMNKSTANKNFFYKDSAEGTHTLTVTLALKPEDESRSCAAWPVAEWGEQWTGTQTVTVGTGSAPQPQSTPASSQASSTPVVLSSTGTILTITAVIAAESAVSAGAGSFFEGAAFGAKGEPLLSPVRYLWNFGDGVIAEGKRVFHAYAYPGSYIVTLTVAYHYSSAEARATVTALAPNVALVAPGDGSLLLSNGTSAELVVGHWSLRDAAGAFVIPEGTRVMPHGGIRFSPGVMGFWGGLSSTLNFPNGVQAASAKASLDSPLRGEPVQASDMERYYAAPLIPIPEGVDIHAPALPAEEGEVLGAATEAVEGNPAALWGSLTALIVLLGFGVVAVRYLQTAQAPRETLPTAEEFEIE